MLLSVTIGNDAPRCGTRHLSSRHSRTGASFVSTHLLCKDLQEGMLGNSRARAIAGDATAMLAMHMVSGVGTYTPGHSRGICEFTNTRFE